MDMSHSHRPDTVVQFPRRALDVDPVSTRHDQHSNADYRQMLESVVDYLREKVTRGYGVENFEAQALADFLETWLRGRGGNGR